MWRVRLIYVLAALGISWSATLPALAPPSIELTTVRTLTGLFAIEAALRVMRRVLAHDVRPSLWSSRVVLMLFSVALSAGISALQSITPNPASPVAHLVLAGVGVLLCWLFADLTCAVVSRAARQARITSAAPSLRLR